MRKNSFKPNILAILSMTLQTKLSNTIISNFPSMGMSWRNFQKSGGVFEYLNTIWIGIWRQHFYEAYLSVVDVSGVGTGTPKKPGWVVSVDFFSHRRLRRSSQWISTIWWFLTIIDNTYIFKVIVLKYT